VVEFLRADQEGRNALVIRDAEPIKSMDDIWASLAAIATTGIFVVLLIAFMYFCRPILLPILSAIVIGMTLTPLVKRAQHFGLPPWLTALVLAVLLLVAVGVAATLLAAPVSEWIGRAPEIGASIKEKFHVLDRPLASLRELQNLLLPGSGGIVAVESPQLSMVTPVVAFVTPAAAEAVIFFATFLFFLAGQTEFRRYFTSFFSSREAKLRFLRIANDIEHNLAAYLVTVTVINFGLGLVVAIGAWLFGLPNPVIFGLLAMLLNYVPYIGAACMAVFLLGVGLVSFPSLGYALLPPVAFVALATLEGQFVTPTILGRRLTLNPLAIFLSLAFWGWLWGPMGAFLAVPLSIIGLVTISHLFPTEEFKLPG
jgi:predicted PurR-regulated permease PerM